MMSGPPIREPEAKVRRLAQNDGCSAIERMSVWDSSKNADNCTDRGTRPISGNARSADRWMQLENWKQERTEERSPSDGTIAGGMIANTKYQICHEGCPDGGNARCGTPVTRVQAGTLTAFTNIDGLDELAF